MLIAFFGMANAPLAGGYRYAVVHGWPSLAEGRALGKASGVAVDSHNHVYVFHSADSDWTEPFPMAVVGTAVAVFDGASGELIAGWGDGVFVMPHGLAIDDAGTLYVADRSNPSIQILDREGSFIAQWPRAKPGRPCGVAVNRAGRVFVVDGGDQPTLPPDRSRVIRLSSSGTTETEFGRFGNHDGQLQMGHDLATGQDRAVYAVDIIGQRVQNFVSDRAPLSGAAVQCML